MKNKIAYKLTVEINNGELDLASIGSLDRRSLMVVLLNVFEGLKIKEVMPQTIALDLVRSAYDENLEKAIFNVAGIEREKTTIDLSRIRKDEDK